jgi:hypothetical protein
MDEALNYCIADPPYLGRAERWYGPTGCGIAKGKGRASAHELAHVYDTVQAHRELVETLQNNYDGWAIAMSVHSLSTYLSFVETDSRNGIRVAVWNKPNAVPSGNRILNNWEPVLLKVPKSRRGQKTGKTCHDVLTCAPPHNGFVGAKPIEWTRWVLKMLGVQDQDEVTDMFPGSGMVTVALSVQELDL